MLQLTLIRLGLASDFLLGFIRKWLGEAKKLCSPEKAKEFQLDSMEKEINLLEKAICAGEQQQQQQWIGFCHNDLQYGNIMIEAENTSITIIVCFYYH